MWRFKVKVVVCVNVCVFLVFSPVLCMVLLEKRYHPSLFVDTPSVFIWGVTQDVCWVQTHISCLQPHITAVRLQHRVVFTLPLHYCKCVCFCAQAAALTGWPPAPPAGQTEPLQPAVCLFKLKTEKVLIRCETERSCSNVWKHDCALKQGLLDPIQGDSFTMGGAWSGHWSWPIRADLAESQCKVYLEAWGT